MLSIFNNLPNRGKGIVRFAEWDYVRNGLLSNLGSVNKYYRQGGYATRSDHPLVGLLFGLYTSVDMDLTTYYRRVDAKALTVAQQLGYTTVMSKGRVWDGVFYAKGSKEVIIVVDEFFDPVEVTKHWRDARPIKVLRHNLDRIDCFSLNGRIIDKDFTVTVINLPMLAVQYRAYRQWQKTYVDEETGRNSIYHFLYAYPLNNTVYSAMDQSIMNRTKNVLLGKETGDNELRHPFHLTNFVMKCDRLLEMVVKSIQDKRLDIASVCLSIPAVDESSMLDVLRLPDVYETRQINWAIYIARVNWIMFLLVLSDFDRQNKSEVSKIRYVLRSYLGDGTVAAVMDKNDYNEQKLLIGELIDRL